MISHYTLKFRAMGCGLDVQIETGADGRDILAAVPAKVEAIEAALSRFRRESELSYLNRHSGEWITVSDALFENVHAAKHAARITDGLYNPLVLPAMIASGYDRSFEQIRKVHPGIPAKPADWHAIELRIDTRAVRLPRGSALDLGGIAKGWTASKLADELQQHGPCLVNIGGDVVVRGAPAGEDGWRIDVEDPVENAPILRVTVQDTSIMTSGIDYRRWHADDDKLVHHIIDPRTGSPAQTDVESVTIIHHHALTAEAYAKAVLILGSQDGLDWLNRQWQAAGLVVRSDGAVLSTSYWPFHSTERMTS